MANSEVERTERRWRENPQGFAFANYADALRKTGEAERALEVLREGLALHPTYLPANIVLGRCHLDVGDDASAHSAFQRVLSLDPENVIALKALADTSERQAHYTDAQRWLEQLLTVDRGNDAAREQLARVQMAAFEAAEAPVPAGVAAGAEGGDGSVASAAPAEAVPALEAPAPAVSEAPAPEPVVAVEAAPAAPDVPATIEEARHGWVSGPENAVEAAPLALDRFPDPVAVAAEAIAEPAPEPEPPLEVEVASPEFAPVEAQADLEPMVEVTDEIELNAHTADEYKIPDASEGFREGMTTSAMPDLEIERSHHDPADDLAVAASAPTLLSPEQDAPSSLPDDVPSIAHETVDGSTAELAATLHDSPDFVTDFVATHAGDAPFADAAPLEGFVGHEDVAPPAAVEAMLAVPAAESAVDAAPVAESEAAAEPEPAPVLPEPVAVPNPVLSAAMSGEEVLEAWRRAAQARAEDLEQRESARAAAPAGAETAADAPEGGDVPEPAVPEPLATAATEEPAEAAPEPVVAMAEDEHDESVFVVTEAMASLYESQGHHRDALRVYRELAVQRPHEPRFAEKVGLLEAVVSAPPPPPAFAAAASGGESVAAFFGRLLQGAPPALARNGHAASPAGGLPTRPAEDPISLGSVFGEEHGSLAGTPRPARAAAPTLDEFYGAAGPGREAGRDEDLEQFHAWLQSLKS